MADSAVKWSAFHITDKGLAMRQKAIAEGIPIEFLRGEIGEGRPAAPEDIWEMTQLVAPIPNVFMKVKRSAAKDANHVLVLLLENEGISVELVADEMGVIARLDGSGEEILYGYAYTEKGHELIPAFENQKREWEYVFNTHISRASNVEILYDGSVVYASQEDLEAHNHDPEAHPNLGATKYLTTIRHELNRFPMGVLYATRYAAGTQGAGEGPAGGEKSRQVVCRLEPIDRSTVEVYGASSYGENPAVHRISGIDYALVYPDSADNLLLILR